MSTTSCPASLRIARTCSLSAKPAWSEATAILTRPTLPAAPARPGRSAERRRDRLGGQCALADDGPRARALEAPQVDDRRRRSRELTRVEHQVGAAADGLGDVPEAARVGAPGQVRRALEDGPGDAGEGRERLVERGDAEAERARVRSAGEPEAVGGVRQQHGDGAREEPLEAAEGAGTLLAQDLEREVEGEEHDRGGLVGAAALERVEPAHRLLRLGVAGEAVDRVGGEHGHAADAHAALEELAVRRVHGRRATTTRPIPARSGTTAASLQPASRQRAAVSASWPCPISSARNGTPRAAASPTSRRTTARPSGPPRSARAGSNGSSSPSRTYGRFATTASTGPATPARRSDSAQVTSRPSRVPFARATSSASAETSTPVTARSGRSSFSASATAPDPVPTSTTRAPAGSDPAASTRCSVSGGGTSTRASTASSRRRKPLRPMRYAAGSPARRRATSDAKRAASATGRPGSRCSAARSTPRTCASSSSASSRSTPSAARRRSDARGGLLGEAAPLLIVLEGVGERGEVALEHLVEVVRGDLHAVVGDAPLGEVVGADLLRPLARPHLRGAGGGLLGPALGLRALVEPRAQHAHRLLAILELRLLVLHGDDDARRLVRDPHRRVRRVHRLPAGAGRAVDVDLEVVGVELHVDLLGLGQHRDGRRRGVDPALRLRLGDPLHTMRAALPLEDRVRAVALDRERVVAVAHLERLGAQTLLLGVAGKHPVEVAGPQAGLLPARARADLDDHVLVVVGVALDHREAELVLEALDLGLGGFEHLACLGVLGLGQQLPRARGIVGRAPPLGGEPARGPERAVLAADLGVALAVADHVGIAHEALELGPARLDLLHELLDHRDGRVRSRPAAGPSARRSRVRSRSSSVVAGLMAHRRRTARPRRVVVLTAAQPPAVTAAARATCSASSAPRSAKVTIPSCAGVTSSHGEPDSVTRRSTCSASARPRPMASRTAAAPWTRKVSHSFSPRARRESSRERSRKSTSPVRATTSARYSGDIANARASTPGSRTRRQPAS